VTALQRPPRVTIAIPVYNGERHLGAAIESILAQTFSDFELIVCDNASTDSTPQIVADFAARDRRVRHQRNPTNIGLLANFNLAFRLGTQSPYFKWAAVDDLCAPTLVEECVRVLDAEPGVVLCHSRTTIIGADGSILYPHPHDGLDTDVADPAARFAELIRVYHWCVAQFGVMRVGAVDGSTPFRRHAHADRVFLAQLALSGRIHELPEALFFFRRHEQASALASRPHRYAWALRPESRGRPVFPSWRLLYELVRAVDRAPITAAEKARCHAHLVRWQLRGLNALRLARDVVVSAGILAGIVTDTPRESR
jgi:glycosyltransferase involved in cell wall biosynthesis